MQTDATDTALARAAQAGDTQAFALLLARHRPLLLAVCRRTMGDSALAEDAAQEAALRALLTLARLRDAEQFGPWLVGIGVNVCRMWLRARARERWSLDALSAIVEHRDGTNGTNGTDGSTDREDVAARIVRAASNGQGADSPEMQVEIADMATAVRRAVALLPQGQRAAVLLYYLSGLSYEEVAATLGIAVGAVKTRLHKARRALRTHVGAAYREGMPMEDSLTTHHCLLCGAANADVHRMVAGANGTAICDACVERCTAIITELDGAPIRYICAFCGKTNDQVRRMVTGAAGSTICDACVARCTTLFARENRPPIALVAQGRA